MDFSLRRVVKENMYYYESDQDSEIQLVFTPGALKPDLWRHQLKYFSRNYKTISFQPTKSFRDYSGEKNALKNVLDQDHVNNAVLISNSIGNSVVQEFESREDVVATVMTGASGKSQKALSKTTYGLLCLIGQKKPKIGKKLLFADSTNYRVVKDFMSSVEPPSYNDFRSFTRNHSIRRPSKKSMIIHADQDRFSSIELAKEMKGEANLSIIQNAGSFCFYEKPQEFNKALADFLQSVKARVEKTEVEKAKENNKSLWDYQSKQKGKEKKQRQEKSSKKKKASQQTLKVKQ